MNSYVMRLDVSEDEVVEKFMQWVRNYADETTLVVVEENPKGDNRHLHAMFKSDSNMKAIRENLKYNFKKYATDSRYYSINEKEGLLMYLCKGPKAVSKIKDPKYPGEKVYPIVHERGSYSEDDITRGHNEWWAAAKTMRINKAEKEEKLPELEAMVKFIEKKNKDVIGQLRPDYSEDDLIKDVIEYYVVNRKLIRMPMISDYCDTIWLILLKTYKREREYIHHVDVVRQNLMNYRIKKY